MSIILNRNWGRDVIGSRTSLRSWRRKVCEFESHRPHQTLNKT